MCQLALLACLFVPPLLRAQERDDRLHYRMPAETFVEPSSQELAANTSAICDGKAAGTACDTCPGDPSPAGCLRSYFRLRANARQHRVGFSDHPKNRQLELDRCHRMRFLSGRQLLLCEGYRMDSWNLLHSVTAVFAKGETIVFRNLLTATDTTGVCQEQALPQKAQIDKIEFRDLNGDGIDDVSFSASTTCSMVCDSC